MSSCVSTQIPHAVGLAMGIQIRGGHAAADTARRGEGPTFLELPTYGVGAHSSSDDPSRYRDESVTEEWKGRRDPIRRFEAYLLARGWIAAGDREALATTLEVDVRDAIARQEKVGAPAL